MFENEKISCVIGPDNIFRTIVLMLFKPIAILPPLGVDGFPDGSKVKERIEWQPDSYTLKEDETTVDTIQPTAMHWSNGVTRGLLRPRWNGAGWEEAATAEEISAWETEYPDPTKPAEVVRAKRNALLNETDRYAVLDAPISAMTRAAFYTYRQALRDIPEQVGFPDTVIWPELPAVVKITPDQITAT